jgi:hypothetical protein
MNNRLRTQIETMQFAAYLIAEPTFSPDEESKAQSCHAAALRAAQERTMRTIVSIAEVQPT